MSETATLADRFQTRDELVSFIEERATVAVEKAVANTPKVERRVPWVTSGPVGRDSDGSGAGLGLSIVRAVADAHGARLELHPRAGGGLEATVAFPSYRTPSGSSPASRRSTWSGVNGGDASSASSWYARNR